MIIIFSSQALEDDVRRQMEREGQLQKRYAELKLQLQEGSM